MQRTFLSHHPKPFYFFHYFFAVVDTGLFIFNVIRLIRFVSIPVRHAHLSMKKKEVYIIHYLCTFGLMRGKTGKFVPEHCAFGASILLL